MNARPECPLASLPPFGATTSVSTRLAVERQAIRCRRLLTSWCRRLVRAQAPSYRNSLPRLCSKASSGSSRAKVALQLPCIVRHRAGCPRICSGRAINVNPFGAVPNDDIGMTLRYINKRSAR